VAQEALIAVAKKIGEFKHAGHRGSFRAWLYQQARWRIADQYRARARTIPSPGPHSLDLLTNGTEGEGTGGAGAGKGDELTSSPIYFQKPGDAVSEFDPTFEKTWDADWTEQVRQAALAKVKRQVSGRQYQLFDLHVLQGLSVRDTAQAAGTSMAAVYMAKSRVGRVLKREIKTSR
jgi:RNA polymerase sigma factor (sigma-70 family)